MQYCAYRLSNAGINSMILVFQNHQYFMSIIKKINPKKNVDIFFQVGKENIYLISSFFLLPHCNLATVTCTTVTSTNLTVMEEWGVSYLQIQYSWSQTHLWWNVQWDVSKNQLARLLIFLMLKIQQRVDLSKPNAAVDVRHPTKYNILQR